MSRQSQNQHRHQQRGQRNPPVPAAIDIGDATLLAIREAMTYGHLATNSSDIMKRLYNDGHQFERHEIELIFSNLHGRALQILINRMSPEMFKSTYGQMMLQTWQTVDLREVIYALSTAHPMCLRVFRVFKGKVEWVGEDSHRATKEDAKTTDNWKFEPNAHQLSKNLFVPTTRPNCDDVEQAKKIATELEECVGFSHKRTTNEFWFHHTIDFVVNKDNIDYERTDEHPAHGKKAWKSYDLYTIISDTMRQEAGDDTMRQQVCEDDWIPPSNLTSVKMADPRRVTGEEGEGRGY
jgi:hypothetical protein